MLYISFSAHAARDENPIIDGMWRGELLVQKGVRLAIGVDISENNAKLTINSPNQGMHDRVPTSFAISGRTLSFKDDGLNASFEGSIENGKITGTFTQGKDMDLTLSKLDENDLKRMKFEGKYSGDLNINASSSLPLVLHIAVIKDGYAAALDSPAQNSFGIPIDKVDINNESLSFTSNMLGAKFSGKKDGEAYAGTFIQGMPMALTLTKVNEKNAHMQFEQPKFGEHGGSIALIAEGDIETKFFAEHNAATQYEIGSITKTMTAYLLARQLASGSIEQSSTTDMFFKQGPAIHVVDLATHTSGLERLPPSLAEARNISNPYANVSRQNLENDLGRVTLLSAEPGHVYSNFAYAVLGEVLAMNHQSTLSDEFDANIFKPLQMSDSYLADTPSKRSKNLAQGHNTLGDSVGPWDFAAASGAGAVVSNLADMLRYTQHMMSEAKNNTALAQRLFSPYTTIDGCCEQGLGWVIMKDKQGMPYAWHNGMTNGFSAFLGFYLDGSRALVMLNNQATSFDKMAHDILTGETGLQII